MDKPRPVPSTAMERQVELDQHDSVRSHMHQRISLEMERLERRIESLRLTAAPHASIMISSYQRMLERKKGFLQSWGLPVDRGY